MKTEKYIPLIVCLLLLLGLFNACRPEDEFTTDSNATLSFSLDTLYFDTVFTQHDTSGPRPISVTKQIRVTNTHKNSVRINVRLAGKSGQKFRLNIDGESTNQKYGKEVLGKDSFFIFVQCYIEPNGANTPLIIADEIIFEVNGNTQNVDLVAWGQDAHYMRNEVLSCTNNTMHWTADKPHVIYDSILVPQGCTLVIDAGAKIHSYNKSCLLVAGTIIVNGTPQNPVIFEGTRLDGEYKDLTNQWAGIRLLAGSKDNVITGAIIRNALVGIEVDSLPVSANPNLRLTQTRIYNMAAIGLLGYTSTILAVNNEITACGQAGFIGALGGSYTLHHNTIASYNNSFNRQHPLVVLDNSPYTDENENVIAKYPLSFELVNNIMYGSLDEEFVININNKGIPPVNTVIQTNLIKTKQGSLNVNGNILNADPLFKNSSAINYALETKSPAKTKATNIGISVDLKNNARSATPSIGCWE